MSDEPQSIATRLKEASEKCTTAHEAWVDNQQDTKAKEALQEAVHELRRIAARLEMDIGHSETRFKPPRQSDEGTGKGPNGNREPKSGGSAGGSGGQQRRHRKPRQKPQG